MRKRFTLANIQFVIVVVACISIIGIYFQNKPAKEIKIESTVTGLGTLEYGLQLNNPIDFDGYWEINKDVYAYLYIDNTKIDYPVLQHESDNSHYLNYTIDGIQGYPGSIYSEKETSKNFDDTNTILYGHNMSSTYGTMFYDLMKYEEETFFKNHQFIYIYTPDYIYQYQVFAAYPFDNRHLLYSYDFENIKEFEFYLEDIFKGKNGIVDSSTKVTSDDKILTLSTCTNIDDDRFLVQAVLKEKVDCKYKQAVPSTFTMRGMKEPDTLQIKETKKQATVQIQSEQDIDLKGSTPYVLLILLVIGSYLMKLHIQKRSKEDQDFYDKYVNNMHKKLVFIGFLVSQAYRGTIQHIKSRFRNHE